MGGLLGSGAVVAMGAWGVVGTEPVGRLLARGAVVAMEVGTGPVGDFGGGGMTPEDGICGMAGGRARGTVVAVSDEGRVGTGAVGRRLARGAVVVMEEVDLDRSPGAFGAAPASNRVGGFKPDGMVGPEGASFGLGAKIGAERERGRGTGGAAAGETSSGAAGGGWGAPLAFRTAGAKFGWGETVTGGRPRVMGGGGVEDLVMSGRFCVIGIANVLGCNETGSRSFEESVLPLSMKTLACGLETTTRGGCAVAVSLGGGGVSVLGCSAKDVVTGFCGKSGVVLALAAEAVTAGLAGLGAIRPDGGFATFGIGLVTAVDQAGGVVD